MVMECNERTFSIFEFIPFVILMGDSLLLRVNSYIHQSKAKWIIKPT